VTFGETAYVTLHGTPGAVIDLYTRRFQGTFTKIRDGLVLDGAGVARVATRPDANLRFQSRDRAVQQASSIVGADGLVTVANTISLTVHRVTSKRYAFTGLVKPAHAGMTVSLFRNGVLVRGGIPVSSGHSYTFTGSLPIGTYQFQTRTGATGYNTASGSPARNVHVD
jgi:hypothetical protein